MVFSYDASDPLAVVTAPPPDETPGQRAAREEREAEARRISDQIDEKLLADKTALKNQARMIKILLLGQSESGKSTTLKNFRMRFAAEKWEQERASWRAIIQLNLVRSVKTILDAIQRSGSKSGHEDRLPVLKLTAQLSPLRRVEQDLRRLLGDDPPDAAVMPPTHRPTSSRVSPSEFYVRSRELQNFLQASQTPRHSSCSARHERVNNGDIDEVISQCADYIKALWENPSTHEILKEQRMRLEDSASFFLEASKRIAARDYQPTDRDIVRARLRTLDIQEHELYIDKNGKKETWKIYDVGGSRTQRHAWLPYFEQVTAIIFLAPVSCFDERLAEDPRVNRLEDSFILWKAICSAELLKHTTLVVFLNKIDLLDKKIAQGVSVKRYLPSYADRPNERDAVVRYLKTKFKDTARFHSPGPRTCHVFATTIIDIETTAQTLMAVQDGVLRASIRDAILM